MSIEKHDLGYVLTISKNEENDGPVDSARHKENCPPFLVPFSAIEESTTWTIIYKLNESPSYLNIADVTSNDKIKMNSDDYKNFWLSVIEPFRDNRDDYTWCGIGTISTNKQHVFICKNDFVIKYINTFKSADSFGHDGLATFNLEFYELCKTLMSVVTTEDKKALKIANAFLRDLMNDVKSAIDFLYGEFSNKPTDDIPPPQPHVEEAVPLKASKVSGNKTAKGETKTKLNVRKLATLVVVVVALSIALFFIFDFALNQLFTEEEVAPVFLGTALTPDSPNDENGENDSVHNMTSPQRPSYEIISPTPESYNANSSEQTPSYAIWSEYTSASETTPPISHSSNYMSFNEGLTDEEKDMLLDLTDLTFLQITNSNLVDIDFLGNLINLEHLDLFGNEIEDISIVANMPNLITLNIIGNRVVDISPVVGLERLENLHISSNRINSLEVLYEMNHLRIVKVNNNRVNQIQIDRLKEMLPNTNIEH